MEIRFRRLPLFMLVSLVGCAAADLEGDPEPAGELELVPPTDEFEKFAVEATAREVVRLDEETASAALLPSGYGLGYVPSPVAISDKGSATNALLPTTTFAPSYDLRTQGKLTPIRDQGSCGSCWAFATYAQSESTLLPTETADFSEEHLNNAAGFDVAPCQGGNAYMSIAYMSRWSGPVAESDAPYTASAQTFSSPLPVRKHLEEALFIPDRSGPTDNSGIKSALLTYGAVFTTMAWRNASWNSATNSFYNAGPSSSSNYVNHAVAIVGWDDNFPAQSFAPAAPGPGAYIIRNSWGTSFGESGYFYASYYDGFIGRGNTVFNVLAATDDYSGVYQYDKYGYTAAAAYSSSVIYGANIFTASASAGLQAVSFWTVAPSISYDVYVYDNPTGSPSSGTLMGSVHGFQAFAGYHTVSVASLGYALGAGRRFSVVVREQSSQSVAYVPLEYPYAGYSSKVSAAAGRSFVGSDGASWTDVGTLWAANIPVKAFVGAAGSPNTPPPSCDDGNACTDDSWNGTTCVHTPRPAGAVCRASTGACDAAEVCNGTAAPCPKDSLAPARTVCRAANGPCDVAEVCTGTSAVCPADTFKPARTLCRAAAGVCDVAETCTGREAACPADAFVAPTVVCRKSGGVCDVAENCTGRDAVCPGDAVQTAGTLCRAQNGVCDVAEVCDGVGKTCPSDRFVTAGTVCRAAAGVCDVAEVCSGRAGQCPTNGFASSGTVCRPAVAACDAAETCTGRDSLCPVDLYKKAGTTCGPGSVCTGGGIVCRPK